MAAVTTAVSLNTTGCVNPQCPSQPLVHFFPCTRVLRLCTTRSVKNRSIAWLQLAPAPSRRPASAFQVGDVGFDILGHRHCEIIKLGCGVHEYCTHTPCRTHIFFAFFIAGRTDTNTHGSKVSAVCMSYLSVSPSPFSCFIRRLCCSRTVTSTPHSRLHHLRRTSPEPKSAGQAHLRTCAGEFGYLADPTHLTST